MQSFFMVNSILLTRVKNMDKNKELTDSFSHLITITERKNIVLSGIKKLNSFDDNEFFVDSIMGPIIIKGDNLELLKLDTFRGNLSIKGKIISVNYLDDIKKLKTESIMSRLFK